MLVKRLDSTAGILLFKKVVCLCRILNPCMMSGTSMYQFSQRFGQWVVCRHTSKKSLDNNNPKSSIFLKPIMSSALFISYHLQVYDRKWGLLREGRLIFFLHCRFKLYLFIYFYFYFFFFLTIGSHPLSLSRSKIGVYAGHSFLNYIFLRSDTLNTMAVSFESRLFQCIT